MAHKKFCALAGKPGALAYEPGAIQGCTCLIPLQTKSKYDDQLKKILERFNPAHYPAIDCGAGWDKIIVDLDQNLNYLCPDYTINQIKEKFGSLRIYWSLPTEGTWSDTTSEHDREIVHNIMRSLVRYAEFLSGTTCEICGEPGTNLVKNYWVKTLCNTCAENKGYEHD